MKFTLHCTLNFLFITLCLSQQYFGQQNSYTQNVKVGNVNCPERNGTFPTGTCDGYIECKDGVGEEKLCPDGLLFNPEVKGFPCQYPIDVDCSGRTSTQPPQANGECPHQYGYFRLGDSANCGQFLNCAAGRAFTFDCPEGLAFNAQTYRCDWPDQVADCDAEAYLGFRCPDSTRQLPGGEYQYFRSQTDCQRYFVCLEGRPRMYNCGKGRAFNDLTNACDGLENVTGCATNSLNSGYTARGVEQKRLF